MVSMTANDHVDLRKRLQRVFRRICPGWLRPESEDLVQAAQMKIVQRGDQAENLQTAFLYRVAHSVMVDEIRRRKRRKEVSFDPLQGPEAPCITGVGPEAAAAGVEMGIAIHQCLADLKPDHKRAVALHLQGHTVPEISKLLGFNRKKAENLVYRGIADLRAALRKRGFEP